MKANVKWRCITERSYKQVECFWGRNPEPYTEPYVMEGTISREKNFDAIDNKDEIEVKKWSGRVDLNHRLHGPEPCALPS